MNDMTKYNHIHQANIRIMGEIFGVNSGLARNIKIGNQTLADSKRLAAAYHHFVLTEGMPTISAEIYNGSQDLQTYFATRNALEAQLSDNTTVIDATTQESLRQKIILLDEAAKQTDDYQKYATAIGLEKQILEQKDTNNWPSDYEIFQWAYGSAALNGGHGNANSNTTPYYCYNRLYANLSSIFEPFFSPAAGIPEWLAANYQGDALDKKLAELQSSELGQAYAAYNEVYKIASSLSGLCNSSLNALIQPTASVQQFSVDPMKIHQESCVAIYRAYKPIWLSNENTVIDQIKQKVHQHARKHLQPAAAKKYTSYFSATAKLHLAEALGQHGILDQMLISASRVAVSLGISKAKPYTQLRGSIADFCNKGKRSWLARRRELATLVESYTQGYINTATFQHKLAQHQAKYDPSPKWSWWYLFPPYALYKAAKVVLTAPAIINRAMDDTATHNFAVSFHDNMIAARAKASAEGKGAIKDDKLQSGANLERLINTEKAKIVQRVARLTDVPAATGELQQPVRGSLVSKAAKDVQGRASSLLALLERKTTYKDVEGKPLTGNPLHIARAQSLDDLWNVKAQAAQLEVARCPSLGG